MVVALADGKIEQVGTFEDCRKADGYIKSLAPAIGSSDSAETVEPTDEVSGEVSASEKKATVKEEDDMRRQLGDWSVYSFYFGTVGVVLIAIMLLLQLVWAFFSTFPSKSHPAPGFGSTVLTEKHQLSG